MITPELISYIKGEIIKGKAREEIRQTLLANGWNELDLSDAFRQVIPMTGNISSSPSLVSAKTRSSMSIKKIITFIVIVLVVGGIGFSAYSSRSNITAFFGSLSTSSSTQPPNPQPIVMNLPAVSQVKDCGVTVKPDPNIPSSYENNQVLNCLGASIVNCGDAEGTISDDVFPTDFKVSKDSNSCNFTLSYPSDSTLVDVTGRSLAGQSITCPVSIVKTVDNTNPKAPVFKTATTADLGKYASDVYFYGTLGVFIENNVDQSKIENAGCSGDYISSVVASYQ